MQLFKNDSSMGFILALALSVSIAGCGASKEDFYGTYGVTKITCNGVDYKETSPRPSDLELKIGETSGYLKNKNWASQSGCSAIYQQSYSWSGTSIIGSFTSCTSEGICAVNPCPDGVDVDLGPATLEEKDGKIILTQSSEQDTEFGEECTDSGEGGLPAKLELQRL